MAKKKRRRGKVPWKFDQCRACGTQIGDLWFTADRIPFSYLTYKDKGKTNRVRVCKDCATQIRSDKASDVRKFALKLAGRLWRVTNDLRSEAEYFAKRYERDTALAQVAANLLAGRKRDLRPKRQVAFIPNPKLRKGKGKKNEPKAR